MSEKTSDVDWEFFLEALTSVEIKPNWHSVAAATNLSHASSARRKFGDLCKAHGYSYDGKAGTLTKSATAPLVVVPAEISAKAPKSTEDTQPVAKKRKIEDEA